MADVLLTSALLSSIVKTRAALQKVYSHWHDEEVRKAAATVAIGPELDQGAKIGCFCHQLLVGLV